MKVGTKIMLTPSLAFKRKSRSTGVVVEIEKRPDPGYNRCRVEFDNGGTDWFWEFELIERNPYLIETFNRG